MAGIRHLTTRVLRAFSSVILLLSCAAAATGSATAVLPQPPLSSPPLVSTTVQPVSPFTIVGFLQKATLDTPGDPKSGGAILVNGHSIRVPANTTVAMPGMFLKWIELFSKAPAPWGPTQTGLALADLPKPLTTFEVMVQGNRTIAAGGDQYIAGLIWVSQESLNTGQGFISFIDFSTGEFRVGGVPNDPTTGARLRLNDPLGRFGRPMTADVRFAIDEDNPTVRTATGYPMCIPRVNLAAASPARPVADDPLCPQINRPKDPATGGFLRQFTMPPPPCGYFEPLPSGAPSVVPPNCTLNPAPGTPDATEQMPFEVGDYVTFQGTLMPDTTTPGCTTHPGLMPDPACQYLSAWSVIANIGAFTAPGTMPAYVAVDVTLMGTGGILNRGLPQEATSIARVEGFTTDPTEPVDIFGVDYDPCTGDAIDRYWGTQPVQQIGKLGRFRFIPLGGTFTPPVRDVRAVSQTLSQGTIPANIVASNTFANGLIAGQYDAPMSRFIFPESAEVGLTRIPLNFQDFPFLMQNPPPGGGAAAGCTASMSPNTLSFSDQPLGKASPPQVVTLRNSGVGGMNIGSISISPEYSQTNDCGTHLPVGGSCTFNVTFTPTSTNPQTGVLQITDTATGSPQSVSLIGTVVFGPVASWSPTSLTFSDHAPGSPSAPQKVTLTNTGVASLNISGIYQSLGFWQTNDCGAALAPGANCTFTIRFTPRMTGAYTGTLGIKYNAVGAPQVVQLSGTSSDFEIAPAAGASMSAWVLPGDAAAYKLRVWGTSQATGTVNLSCAGLPPGATCAFSPAAVSLHGAQDQPVTLWINTTAPRLGRTSTANNRRGALPFAMSMFGLVGVVFTRKRSQKALLCLLIVCALGMSGCGGGFGNLSAPGGSQVTVIATASNGAVHQVQLRLTVSNPAPLGKPPANPRAPQL